MLGDHRAARNAQDLPGREAAHDDSVGIAAPLIREIVPDIRHARAAQKPANAKRLEGLYPDGETRAAFDPDGKTGAFDAMPDLDKTRARPPPIPTDAVEKAAVEQQAKTPWDKDAIEAARARLQKIATGKNMINKAAPVAGVVGFATGGPMGIVAGMSAKPAVNAATMAGKALEKSGKAALTPEAMAKSLLGNPNVLTKLAASNGPLSGAAKFVLSGAKEAGEDGLRSRVFVLSMMPEFREWFGQNRDAQGR